MKLSIKTVLIILTSLIMGISMVSSSSLLAQEENSPLITSSFSLSAQAIDNLGFKPIATLNPDKILSLNKKPAPKAKPAPALSKKTLPKTKITSDKIRLLTTGYCKCQKCCDWKYNWRGRPVLKYSGRKKIIGQTASGKMARVGTVAADTRYFKFGTKMNIPGYGSGVVQDRGGKIKGYHIDLYFNTHREAKNWGRRYVTVNVKR